MRKFLDWKKLWLALKISEVESKIYKVFDGTFTELFMFHGVWIILREKTRNVFWCSSSCI